MIWIVLLVAAGVAIGAWVTRAPAPAQRSEADLSKARADASAGRWKDAANAYSKLARDESLDSKTVREPAAGELEKLAVKVVLGDRPIDETVEVLALALDTVEETSFRADEGGITSATVSRALDRANAVAGKDPRASIALVDLLTPVVRGSVLEERAVQARAAALAAIVQRDSSDMDSLGLLAAIDLDAGKPDAARARLAPVASKLGTSEGARVMGLCELRDNKPAEGVAYLGSYFEAKLPAFDQAQQNLHAAVDTAQRRAQLDPAFAKRMHEATDEATKQRLYAAHQQRIRSEIQSDPGVRAARRAVQQVIPLVEVAIALAQVELGESRGKPEPERSQRLARAKKDLEAVGAIGVMASDAWFVWLARVRIELGEIDKLRENLDDWVNGRGKSYNALLIASELLAEAGDMTQARTAAETAYAAARTREDKERAAQMRVKIAEAPDDQILWLARAGATPASQAMVEQARASAALAEGRFEAAAAGFESAAGFYETQQAGRAAPLRVQGALLRLAKMEATGKDEDLDQAIAALEKLDKDDVPLALLDGLVDGLLARAISKAVGDRLRVSVLHDRSMDLLELAPLDKADAQAILPAFTSSPDRKRALELCERLIALAPFREKPYGVIIDVAFAEHDAATVEATAARLDKAWSDRERAGRELADYWSGKEDAHLKTALESHRKRADTVLELARQSGHAPTIAAALVARASIEREAASLAVKADRDLAVKLAEEAVTIAPRRHTWIALRNALIARAADRARASSTLLAKMFTDHPKAGIATLLSWTLPADAALATALAADPDVHRAADLHALALAQSPFDPEPHDALVYRVASDARAGSVGKDVAASRFDLAHARARVLVASRSPEAVSELALLLGLRGEKEERAKVIEVARKAGVALPYDVLSKD